MNDTNQGAGDQIVSACGITLDYSRQQISEEAYGALVAKACEMGVDTQLRDMFEGRIVNAAENRAALHTSLRSFNPAAPKFDIIDRERERFLSYAEGVRSGYIRGCRGDKIRHVVNIGIGGSNLGPRAVVNALNPENSPMELEFVGSCDGYMLHRIFAKLDPFKTLILVSSKTFTTLETMTNAKLFLDWFQRAGISGDQLSHHVACVSAKPDAHKLWDLPEENQFTFWDWVGGRFSLWSSIGLAIAISVGRNKFLDLLRGAEAMDRHVLSAPPEKNIPWILALSAWHNTNKRDIQSMCILPYDDRLCTLTLWLQQLEMESLGKPQGSNGGLTGQCVWTGGNANEGQHSFFQWLRMGMFNTCIDVVWCAQADHEFTEHHKLLVKTAKVQCEALTNRPEGYINPLNAIELDRLDPQHLGALMAMYEHKTVILSLLCGINAFDQPGVEYGKKMLREVLKAQNFELP